MLTTKTIRTLSKNLAKTNSRFVYVSTVNQWQVIQANQTNNQHFLQQLQSKLFSSQVPKPIYRPKHAETKTENLFTCRTHTCGELTAKDVGKRVAISGWLEYKRLSKFVIIRDAYGSTQCLVTGNTPAEVNDLIQKANLESIVQVSGVVVPRPEAMIRKDTITGEIEIDIEALRVVNESKPRLPFNIRGFQKAKESLRLQYRYLDLRFPEMQRTLRARSQILFNMRQQLITYGFVEVETPTLFKKTPGGAQEFIVPTHTPQTGKCYALTQSPQQLKQLLMIGSVDRYFQIAKCYRDESARPDRQPEFTQLDVEMSFTSADGVMALVENVLTRVLMDLNVEISRPFERLKYVEAICDYGLDKPDVRVVNFEGDQLDLRLVDVTRICMDLIGETFGVSGDDRHKIKSYSDGSLTNPANNLIDHLITSDDFGGHMLQIPMKLTRKINWNDLLEDLKKTVDEKNTSIKFHAINMPGNLFNTNETIDVLPQNDDVKFFAYGNKLAALDTLGRIRALILKSIPELMTDEFKFIWITDFPLFVHDGEKLTSAHHPFTLPRPDQEHELESNDERVLEKIHSQSYDLVLNGMEVGGGSIRVHNRAMQERIFEILGLETGELVYFFDALDSGCPPHGGIALGIDRLLSVILRTNSIRDVISFPKGVDGKDLMTGAPSEISQADKVYYFKGVRF